MSTHLSADFEFIVSVYNLSMFAPLNKLPNNFEFAPSKATLSTIIPLTVTSIVIARQNHLSGRYVTFDRCISY